MNLSTIIGISYLISVPYVIWKLIKRNKKTSLDGVIGITPGFDGLVFIGTAPFWMLADLIATWVILFIEHRKSKKEIL